MQELGKLFGSEDRVKLIRLFLGNESGIFQIDDIVTKTKIKKESLKKELVILERAGLITKSKEKFALASEKVKNTKKIKLKEYICYSLNKDFRFLTALESLMFDFQNANKEVLKDRFKVIGKMKYLMISGVFTGDKKARCDIMYVGEGIKSNLVEKLLIDIQAEIGKKLNILIFDSQEFEYRYKMFDRLVRDALKDDIEVLVNKINI